jgi:hypothetical protein
MNNILDDYTNKILDKIYTNQNLCKLIAIDDNNDPLSYPNIEDTKILFDDNTNKRIFTTHFNIDIIDTQRTTLTINVNEARLDRGNVFYKDITIDFFIIAPYNLWQLNATSGVSKLRPNAIIHELSSMFISERTVGIGKDIYGYLTKIQPNQVMGGYRLALNAKDFVLNN